MFLTPASVKFPRASCIKAIKKKETRSLSLLETYGVCSSGPHKGIEEADWLVRCIDSGPLGLIQQLIRSRPKSVFLSRYVYESGVLSNGRWMRLAIGDG